MLFNDNLVTRFADVFWGWSFLLFTIFVGVGVVGGILLSNTSHEKARFFGTLTEFAALVYVVLLLWFGAIWTNDPVLNWFLVAVLFGVACLEWFLLLLTLYFNYKKE